MKTLKTLFVSAIVALVIPAAVFAQSNTFSGKVYFKKANLKVDSSTIGDLNKAQITNRTRYVDLPMPVFVQEANGAVPPATGTPVPIRQKENNIPSLMWAVGDTAKAAATFRVPADYVSGQSFVCMVGLAASSADTTIDFEIYKNATGAAFDAATTNQTPVAVADNATNMQDITLTVATDTFTANDVVTLNVWRAAGTGSGAELHLYNCKLEYTADM